MFGRHIVSRLLTRKATVQPTRTFAQVGHIICTPPRHVVSYPEKVMHGIVMWAFWLAPIMYFHSQIKVWRRTYSAPAP